MAKKKDQTLLYVGLGVAAIYFLTKQQRTQTTIPQVQPQRPTTWVDVALEYGDDLFDVLFKNRRGNVQQTDQTISIQGLTVKQN